MGILRNMPVGEDAAGDYPVHLKKFTMRIAILVPTIKPGGAEKQAALLARSLCKKHEVRFISFNGMADSSESILSMLESADVKTYFLEGSSWKKCRILYDILKDEQIEVAFNYITYPDCVGALVEKMAGVRTVYNGIRNSRLELPKLIMEWFAHNFIADYTVFNCHSGADYFISKGYRKSKAIVIPNCFPEISGPIVRPDKEVKTVITVARFEKQKDYLTAIKSIAALKQIRNDFLFTIIGHGILEQQIRGWVKEYGIEDVTTIHVAPDNVQEILREADIYVSTSLFEGTSNSIMEAMNWSIPVVATDVGDNRYLVEHGKNGYLVDVGDSMAITDRLAFLLENDDRRCLMGQDGNRILHRYSVETFENAYDALLDSGKES